MGKADLITIDKDYWNPKRKLGLVHTFFQRQSQAAQARKKRNKWHVRERDSCLRAVLCYKDSIYKGLHGNFTGLI